MSAVRAQKKATYRGMGDPAASHACITAEPKGNFLEIRTTRNDVRLRTLRHGDLFSVDSQGDIGL
jgi:hypothetical protein